MNKICAWLHAKVCSTILQFRFVGLVGEGWVGGEEEVLSIAWEVIGLWPVFIINRELQKVVLQFLNRGRYHTDPNFPPHYDFTLGLHIIILTLIPRNIKEKMNWKISIHLHVEKSIFVPPPPPPFQPTTSALSFTDCCIQALGALKHVCFYLIHSGGFLEHSKDLRC